MLTPGILKLHRYIDHDWQMTPLDFQVTRSRTQWLETIKWFPDDNSIMLTPRILKLHIYIDNDWQMTPIDFQVTRSRSEWLEIVKWFPYDNSRIIRPRIMKLHRYIDHDWQMTPIYFQVTMSKVKVTGTKKRIHTMAATTTDSPYGGHSCFTNSPCCYSFSFIRHSTFLTLDYFLFWLLFWNIYIYANHLNYA